MLLLAVDTATSAVTVALHDGTRTLAEQTTLDARRHAELLAPALERVLAETGHGADEVTAVVAGTGPGPFTGLRVGLVTARTFAFVRGIPVYGVCSLDVLAHQAWLQRRGVDGVAAGSMRAASEPAAEADRLLVATDARRKEVYWATYRLTERGAAREGEPQVSRPAELPQQVCSLPTVGRGPVLYPELLPQGGAPLDVSAAALADLAARALRGDADRDSVLTDPEPLYLRRPDAQPQGARKPVLH
ncbi:MAG TPA: tRNA (adenosine(37)-N6)-threonylcarbamoyltransferase complex dimerization subunit type 1 TsaB [Segeticoccus sp.]|uniref:tRNA (adenosine(37)-N6)-threonylcarbamoyltransferase complex dimerization subunit type 1 TsaB n=1 Tax=Segeticoccus sp. TaxID=2706531 RepID=UPI002D7EEF96|nr:tRNA (adenosine(37)-N6)-threonylcarbamoyltransferase complex dimerization subunit type 1 TsaB [Segeticoccus sp.]HET8599421.1 tRNA (adenosine(37)-N6)-threonylcarbamoyltransferase complex dimerization subunit type 1 TsaB [Segeticoccus sp.]